MIENATESLAAAGGQRPVVTLPGKGVEIGEAGETLGRLLAAQRTHFLFHGNVVRLSVDERGQVQLLPIKAVMLASDLETVATFNALTAKGKLPATCSEGKANEILHCQRFRQALPPLRQVTNCPVILERDGQAHVVTGYDEVSGIYAMGAAPPPMSLEEARELLRQVIADFQFATDADRSRALAAMISPALTAGDWLHGRVPIDLGEADQSQTGKGYRNKLTTAIYGDVPFVVNQRKGVGSLDESFQKAVMEGRQFISMDNVRGLVDSQFMESFMTESLVTARAAYTTETPVETRGVTVMLTSNNAELTADLANRSSCVRLLKRRDDHQFEQFAEGGILEHVQAHQPRFLGAVFAVVAEWARLGKPGTKENRHSFRQWCQSLDWIVQRLLREAPLMDGHRETQSRMSSPAHNWLREVVLEIVRQGRCDQKLLASHIVQFLDDSGTIEIPGAPAGTDLGNDAALSAAQKQVGRRLSTAFGQHDRLDVDGWIIQRCSYTDAKGNDRKSYVVASREGELSPVEPLDPFGWDGVIDEDDFPSDDSSNDPLTAPFDKSRVSFDASDDSPLLAGIVSGERLGAFGGREVLAAMEGIGGSEGDGLGEEVFEAW